MGASAALIEGLGELEVRDDDAGVIDHPDSLLRRLRRRTCACARTNLYAAPHGNDALVCHSGWPLHLTRGAAGGALSFAANGGHHEKKNILHPRTRRAHGRLAPRASRGRRSSRSARRSPSWASDGRQLTLTAAEVQELRAALHGELLAPGQEGYDGARRLWNAAFDKKPALIARCADAADVQQAVRFASSHALLTAVRAAGVTASRDNPAATAGWSSMSSPMRAVRIDRGGKLAHVQAGSSRSRWTAPRRSSGLATVLGTVADTGVAGLTLGGGEGRLSRQTSGSPSTT